MVEGPAFDLPGLLQAANPWWQGGAPEPMAAPPTGLPRALALLQGAPPPQLLVIEGGRQTGKSHLLAALAAALLADGCAPEQVCRIALDLTALRWCSAEAIDAAWAERTGTLAGRRFQLVDDLDCWPQREQDSLAQLSLDPGRTVVVAARDDPGRVMRWRAAGLRVARLQLAPVGFGGFLAQRGVAPELPPPPRSLRELFDWPIREFARHQTSVQTLNHHIVDYLQRGGYPGAIHARDPQEAQRHLREDLLPRILRWDAPARHGVRRGDDLERTLHHLAAGAGALLDVPALCAEVSVERPTVRHFLDLLEDAGLLLRLAPVGYGHSVQRARWLVTLPDPALAGALLQRPPSAHDLGDPALAGAISSALSRHLHAAYRTRGGALRYAQLGRRTMLVVESGSRLLPFLQHDVPGRATPRGLAPLATFCTRQGLPRAYVATRLPEDFGPLPRNHPDAPALMRIPSALLCLWLAAAEPDPVESDPAESTGR